MFIAAPMISVFSADPNPAHIHAIQIGGLYSRNVHWHTVGE